MNKLFKIGGRRLQLIVYALIMGACFHASVGPAYFDENGTGDKLVSSVLAMDSTRIGACCNCVIDDRLIMECVGMPHRYEIFIIRGDSLAYESNFLNIGRGPYEMNNPEFQYDPVSSRMFLYSRDNLEDKLFTVDVSDFRNVYDPSGWEKKKLPVLYTRGSLGILSDTVFLNKNYTGTSAMFSLSYAGSKDNTFRCLNFKYPGEHPDLSLSARNYLFMGELKPRPGSSTFVYSCSLSPCVFIFDVINEQIQNVRYISRVLPVYKATNDFYNPVAMKDEYIRGFDVFQVSGKYIYIGYNNVTWGQIRNSIPFKGYPYYFFDRINVFDWEGNFIKRLVLDRPVYRFAADAADKYLYASSIDLTQENQPDQVLRFELKP